MSTAHTTFDTDGPLAPEYRRPDLVDALYTAVWGQGFAPPVFSEEVEVVSQKLVGERHLQLKIRHQGQPVDGQFRVTQVFVHDGGRWALASLHLSQAAPPGRPSSPGGAE